MDETTELGEEALFAKGDAPEAIELARVTANISSRMSEDGKKKTWNSRKVGNWSVRMVCVGGAKAYTHTRTLFTGRLERICPRVELRS